MAFVISWALYHGYGVMRFENGYIYEGNWKEGKRNGVGKATFTDGMIYEGGGGENFVAAEMGETVRRLRAR